MLGVALEINTMKKADARIQIIREWHGWVEETHPDRLPSGNVALGFYGHLQTNRPDLLNFRASGDKWQVVHGWLLNARLVGD